MISEHHCQLEICLYSAVDAGAGYSYSILDVMRTAQLASRELSRNISKNLPSDYTPLTLAEVFYMATMGGAQGINLSYSPKSGSIDHSYSRKNAIFPPSDTMANTLFTLLVTTD